ncbi:hypothetical protein [Phyllobacterium phragmitis]|uniref:hypothetical protein n=1 Tax=Phyllobacterium phragmitis TaxID=2670329 RepID=UPI0011B1C979|nr:hypothetical protein [Phyllobacterium phragmitis]
MIGLDVHRLSAVEGLSWQLDLLPTGRFYPQPALSRLGLSGACAKACESVKSMSCHGEMPGRRA